MKEFKNYIWMAAGFAALIAVISGITAAPAIAALVKAALVQNVDEPGRSPFLSSETGGGGTCDADNCTDGERFNGPGANTRLVVKDVSLRAYLKPGGKVFSAQLFSCPTPNTGCNGPAGAPTINLPISLQASSAKITSGFPLADVWVTNQQVDFYVEAGSIPEVLLIMDSGESATGFPVVYGSVSGYSISLP